LAREIVLAKELITGELMNIDMAGYATWYYGFSAMPQVKLLVTGKQYTRKMRTVDDKEEITRDKIVNAFLTQFMDSGKKPADSGEEQIEIVTQITIDSPQQPNAPPADAAKQDSHKPQISHNIMAALMGNARRHSKNNNDASHITPAAPVASSDDK